MSNLFTGVTVIDFSSYIAGPHATTYMAHYGANVIKIERPKRGDESRTWKPLLEGDSIHGLYLNVGKKSVAIDTTTSEGIELCKKLVTNADVIIESFKPGTMKKLRLDYESVKEINPGVIYCSVSAYGQTGPSRSKPGFDNIAWASSGLMDMTGEADGTPMRVGAMLSDYVTSLYAFGTIASALFYREKTGLGNHIDLSMQDCLVSLNNAVDNYMFDGVHYTRTGLHSPRVAPFGTFFHPKGYVVICAGNEAQWKKLVVLIGKPELLDDPRLANVFVRAQNLPYLKEIIEEFLARYDKVEDAVSAIDAAGIPVSKVYTVADVEKDPQLNARGMIREYKLSDKYEAKTFRARGNPMNFSGVDIEENIYSEKLGEHTVEIMHELGLADAQIEQLLEKGVIDKY